MAKYMNEKKLQQELFKRTEGYAASVRQIYLDSLSKIIEIVKGTELEDGKPFSFSEYGYSEDVTPILRSMYSRVYQSIRGGVEKEWLLSNENNDGLVKSVFGEQSIEDKHFARFFQHNMDAMDAFFARKTKDGLNLSQKVWKYTGMYKEELEKTLELAIGEGIPANRLATKIKEYLNDPDRWYRRFRVKIGEDENGNPVYGRKWKRRVFDKETDTYKWIDDNPKKYHPGSGVYRSSYRNAQRLARTETNIAYRSADYERWQQLDFVVGIEIKLSNNHPVRDICDDLKGIYPKKFKWTGWHPQCRCYQVPVMAKDEEIDKMLDKILDGESTATVNCENEVKELPSQFTGWMDKNKSRINDATQKGTLPYFLRDNDRVINPNKQEMEAMRIRRKEIAKTAAALLLNRVFSNPDFESPMRINMRGIKEWLNQPHSQYTDKNEMLVNIGDVLGQSTYRGWTFYHKDNPMVAKTHVFEISINGDPSYILAREYVDGEVFIYSISDSDKVLNGIQK